MTSVQTEMEAFTLRQLVKHLQANPQVQNIDIMNTAGFCRNCLSKWYLAAARKVGLPYDYGDACRAIYGMSYGDYKSKHQTKATKEQLDQFNANKEFHAKHAPEIENAAKSKPKGDPSAGKQDDPPANGQSPESPPPSKATSAPTLSDVCCEDPLGPSDSSAAEMVERVARSLAPSNAEPVNLKLGILTVSDRAFQKVYSDLSGPEIQACVVEFAEKVNSFRIEADPTTKLVPDETEDIQIALEELASTCNLVLTTGGTGLSPRDVTPEATLSVVDREVRGIPEVIRRETARFEPLAALSRAAAGIRGSCLIVNLPGRPKACREALSVLLPLLSHALTELQKS
mmetsp:Transcript_9544/g.16730  ORF Transcript_9544/g.16730 Transcript_9544/m.16730 type:complete len:343 (+) Transcript_9544:187-1215(+)|eukprot:CAMPEP_0184523676 /NCGR_PEP_ID=MMETSP0198_2-20121128/9029_1 /TAXON_ID=1112570 /ORGANISM="Thraustochytrium sp., Strain LLF1b" /LENGTH=342 /DNA_ID=CAMNT_0026914759 /DNA_START=101 /DNA_END=1129 /DNA_ORIENTATION=+